MFYQGLAVYCFYETASFLTAPRVMDFCAMHGLDDATEQMARDRMPSPQQLPLQV